IVDAWQREAEVEGFALLWSAVYGHLADQLEASPALRAATLLLRYENLCREPEAVLTLVMKHCELSPPCGFIAAPAARLRTPNKKAKLDESELTIIARCTNSVAGRLECAQL